MSEPNLGIASEGMRRARHYDLLRRPAVVQPIVVDLEPRIWGANPILNIVSDVTGCPVPTLRGGRVQREYAYPRFMACWTLRNVRPELSFPMIGRMLGGRDHTTIIYACRRAGELRHTEPFATWFADPRILRLLQQEAEATQMNGMLASLAFTGMIA